MKKSLIIVLLTIVSSIECISMAQEANEDSKQKIIDYVNCFYTAKYVLSDSAIPTEEKQVIKERGIDTVSIVHAYKYADLDSILRNNNLIATADNLTKKLNDRNCRITDYNDIFDFVDKVVITEGFENFKFTRKNECDVRNAILRWCNNYKKNESGDKEEKQSSKDKKEFPFDWGWIPLAFIILCALANIIMNIKSRSYNDTEKPQPDNFLFFQKSKIEELQAENSKLKAENEKLRKELKGIGDKRKEVIEIKPQKEVNSDEIRSKDVEKIATSTVDILYYADIDVSNNIFVRTYKEETRISVYAINVNQQTFVPIENKQLYEKLYMVNSSGILGACEVKNSYQKGKSISITPGKVQQEENGKWRIINKAIIEIK